MLRCKDVVRLIASEELARSGWMKRLMVRLHLVMCAGCRRYARQIRELGRAAREIWGASPEDESSARRILAVVASKLQGGARPRGPRP